MADENDPIQQAASAEIKRQEDPSNPAQLELRAPYRIAADNPHLPRDDGNPQDIAGAREHRGRGAKEIAGAREHRGRDLLADHPERPCYTFGMDEITSGAMQRLLGVNKVSLRGPRKRGDC